MYSTLRHQPRPSDATPSTNRSTLYRPAPRPKSHGGAQTLNHSSKKWRHNTLDNGTPIRDVNQNKTLPLSSKGQLQSGDIPPEKKEEKKKSSKDDAPESREESVKGQPSSKAGSDTEHTPAVAKARTGKFVNRDGMMVWWKEPRFRGSGTVVVLDDPVRDGRKLAKEIGEGLVGDESVEMENGEGKGLRYEDGEREGEFGFGEIAKGEAPGYAVKVVERRRGKTKEKAEGDGTQIQATEAGTGLVAESASESVSDSDSGSECDLLFDFSEEEAKGWVPVMVAEEDEGDDDWMSLTGSWVMMRGPQVMGK